MAEDKKGYIKKVVSPSDGRKMNIMIQEEGRSIYFELKDNMHRLNQEMLDGISKDELEGFLNVLHKMQNNLEKEGIL